MPPTRVSLRFPASISSCFTPSRIKKIIESENVLGSRASIELALQETEWVLFIAFIAKKQYSFGLSPQSMNKAFWNDDIPAKGVSPAAALQDINGENAGVYAMDCVRAAKLSMAGGIAQALGAAAFDAQYDGLFFAFLKHDEKVPDNDWIPGDWGGILNTGQVGGKQPGHTSENLIYAGNGLWWGHIQNGNTYKPLQGADSWFNVVLAWNKGATIENFRYRPAAGLEN